MKIRWYENGELQSGVFQKSDDEKDYFICIWLDSLDRKKQEYYLVQKIVNEYRFIIYDNYICDTIKPIHEIVRQLTEKELQEFIDEDGSLYIWNPTDNGRNWAIVQYSEISCLLNPVKENYDIFSVVDEFDKNDFF
jgi:hypothetical protein